jgi:3-methyladenine DNA glycosylase AlkC
MAALRSDRVTTRNEQADQVIRSLLDLAHEVKCLGDRNLHLEAQIRGLASEGNLLRHELDDVVPWEGHLTSAIADFDRGLISREELIALGRQTW